MSDLDPIFGIPTPLLFAHRGGAKEVPESTERGFDYARAVGADVLELDVNLTADREIAVWHGPSLKNVRLGCESDVIKERRRKNICDFKWGELAGNAWVDDYRDKYVNVGNVPKDPDRQLLLLQDMLSRYPDDPINVELKGSFGEGDVTSLATALENSPQTQRRILIVSADQGNIDRVEKELVKLPPESQDRYALGFSALQVLGAALRAWLPFITAGRRGRALQTTYWWPLCPKKLVDQVHERKGAVHVFVAPFWPIPGLDEKKGGLKKHALLRVLKRGVDGIMTDRPSEVRPILDEWKRSPSLD